MATQQKVNTDAIANLTTFMMQLGETAGSTQADIRQMQSDIRQMQFDVREMQSEVKGSNSH